MLFPLVVHGTTFWVLLFGLTLLVEIFSCNIPKSLVRIIFGLMHSLVYFLKGYHPLMRHLCKINNGTELTVGTSTQTFLFNYRNSS